MTYQISDFKVGQEVVLMACGRPVRCNSVNNPDHPCRSTITKVGRTRVYGLLTGSDKPRPFALNENQTGFLAVPVEDAKKIYGEALANHPRRAELVESL